MTISSHPTDASLARFVAGTLETGPRLVVATHLGGCRHCRDAVATFEAVGGVLVDEIAPVALAPDALAHTFARLERVTPVAEAKVRRTTATTVAEGLVLPAALADCTIGPWRWIAPGIRFSRLRVAKGDDTNLVMFKVAAGQRLPEHGHTGTEFTQVLTGSLMDGAKRYWPGDLVEADAEMDHEPIAGPEGECICLAAVEGKLRLRSLVGRVVQSFVGL